MLILKKNGCMNIKPQCKGPGLGFGTGCGASMAGSLPCVSSSGLISSKWINLMQVLGCCKTYEKLGK